MAPMKTKLYRPHEAAELLAVREDSVWSWMNDDVIRCVHRRGERLVPESEVERLLEAWGREPARSRSE
jgi:hypothetical protein